MRDEILPNYANKWVALSKDRSKVLYAAKTLDGLFKKLSKVKKEDVILHYFPPLHTHLSP